MSVRELVFQYSSKGAAQAAKADEKVRSQIQDTARTAKQESGTVERWMTRHRNAINNIAAATAGALGAVVAASPTMRAELSGIRSAFGLFADTVMRDVLPATGSLTRGAFGIVESFRELNDTSRGLASGLFVIAGVAGAVALAVGAVPAAIAGVTIAVGLLLDRLGLLRPMAQALVAPFRAFGLVLEGDVAGAVHVLLTAYHDLTMAMKDLGTSIGEALRLDAVGEWASDVADRIGELASDASDWGNDTVSNFASGMKDRLGSLRDSADDTVSAVGGRLKSMPGDAYDRGTEIVGSIRDGLDDRLHRARGGARSVMRTVDDILGGIPSDAYQWGKDIVNELVDGLRDAFDSLAEAVDAGRDIIEDKLSFDLQANDRAARRWGSDLVEEMSMGVESARPELEQRLAMPQPSAGGGGGGRNVTVENIEVVVEGTGNSRRDGENVAQKAAEEFERTLGSRGV